MPALAPNYCFVDNKLDIKVLFFYAPIFTENCGVVNTYVKMLVYSKFSNLLN